uniref:Methyltransferase domain-containing protein n=3 Tax=Clastoptera arizonana TaxID=38151 RepID=A0A1B6CCJ0_9HEMI
MVIHSHFETYGNYFYNVLLFLEEVSWLFDFPVTRILSTDIFSKIPSEWITPLLSLTNDELNLFPTGITKEDWPESLKLFQEQCKRLTLPVLSGSKVNQPDGIFKNISNEIWRGMSPKKRVEVESLSSLVHAESQALNISKIVDVGSGHGYIDRLLLTKDYQILGFESNMKMINYTLKHLEKTFPKSTQNYQYVQMSIQSNSLPSVREAIEKYLFLRQSRNEYSDLSIDQNGFESKTFPKQTHDIRDTRILSLIGLHACGDLTIDSMKLFLNLPEVKLLILVPCCYHKMKSKCESINANLEHKNKQMFHNFPASKTLRSAIETRNVHNILQWPFLRLAGQATWAMWKTYSKEDHESHAFNVLSRAVIQLYSEKGGPQIKKFYRSIVTKSDLQRNDFNVYINRTFERCNITNQNTLSSKSDVGEIKKELLNLWDEHKNKLKLIEIITGLQMCIESVAESLVAADRACFLFENGIKDIRLIKLFDSNISPRGLVYVATKSNKSFLT